MGRFKKVIFVEDFFATIKEVHEKELLHAGYHKTYKKVLPINAHCVAQLKMLMLPL